MRRWLVVFVLLISTCLMFQVSGLDVDETELSAAQGTSVEFINYEGPHSKIETREQIMGIGSYLASIIAGGSSRAGVEGKYSLIHAVDPAELERSDADIFVLLPDAVVDHIRNIRLMITGYLMGLYSYDDEDAAVLAEFLTIYNAVFRRKMDYITGTYKRVVLDNLTNEAAGISTVYTDWPGQTMMLVPLTERAAEGGLGSLDSDALTEEEVIEELRSQDDLGLESRKEITELKEREVEEEQQRIDEERDELREEAEEVADRQEEIETERARIEDARDDPVADTEALGAREEELQEEEEELREEEVRIAAREEELDEREQDQEDRVERIQTEREQIASDERALIGQEEPEETEARTTGTLASIVEAPEAVLFIELIRLAGESLGRLVFVDASTGEVMEASTVNTIRNQGYFTFDGKLLVSAGTTSGQGAVRLMLLDSQDLSTLVEGNNDVHEGTSLLVADDFAYAVVQQDDEWRLGKFDSELNLLRVSDQSVDPETHIASHGENIYAQDTDGGLIIFSSQSLTARIVRP